MTRITLVDDDGSADASMCSAKPTTSNDETKLQKFQRQEEYMIDKYTLVLESLKSTFLDLEEEYMSSDPDTFRDRIMRGLMAQVRDYIKSNEGHLREARRELWLGFDEEVDVILENGMKR